METMEHLKEPAIFIPCGQNYRDVFELPPCWKAMIVFMFVFMDHVRQEHH